MTYRLALACLILIANFLPLRADNSLKFFIISSTSVGSDGTQYKAGDIVRATRVSVDGVHLWTPSGKDSIVLAPQLRAITTEDAALKLFEIQATAKVKASAAATVVTAALPIPPVELPALTNQQRSQLLYGLRERHVIKTLAEGKGLTDTQLRALSAPPAPAPAVAF